jgi:lysozyme family protein
MSDFRTFLKKILKWEGGYANHPNDRGGCTNKGIILSTYRQYFGASKTCEDLKKITDEEVEHIYKKGFWDACRCDDMNSWQVAHLIADWAVNSGVRNAAKGVQKIVGAKADGIIGPLTIKAINEREEKELFESIKEARKEFYENIVKRNPSQKVFLKGWMNRLNDYNWV